MEIKIQKAFQYISHNSVHKTQHFYHLGFLIIKVKGEKMWSVTIYFRKSFFVDRIKLQRKCFTYCFKLHNLKWPYGNNLQLFKKQRTEYHKMPTFINIKALLSGHAVWIQRPGFHIWDWSPWIIKNTHIIFEMLESINKYDLSEYSFVSDSSLFSS